MPTVAVARRTAAAVRASLHERERERSNCHRVEQDATLPAELRLERDVVRLRRARRHEIDEPSKQRDGYGEDDATINKIARVRIE